MSCLDGIPNKALTLSAKMRAIHGNDGTSQYSTVITLDVQIAFNPVSWNLIRRSFAVIGVPSYLTALVDSYLAGRQLWYDTNSGPR